MSEAYFVEVDTNGCASCGARRTWHVVGPGGMAGSVSYEDVDAAEAEADMKNDAFERGLSDSELLKRRLASVLKKALDQTGCDGDLCMHDWHEEARNVLGEIEESA